MLSIATWNLENFGRPSSSGGPTSQDAYEAKVSHLAQTITAIGADVIGVQEVLDPDALEDLKTALGSDWQAATSSYPDDPHHPIRVGFLSKLEFNDREDIVDFPAALLPIQQEDGGACVHRMGRGALRVTVEQAGLELQIVCCHLKSKLLSFPNPHQFEPSDEDQRARYAAYALFRRAAEATTVRCYADERLHGHGQDVAFIVLGDMNDEVAAASTQTLLGPPGSQIKPDEDTSPGDGGYGTPDRGDGMRLWSLAPLIPLGDRWSRIFEGHHELIDHMLASHRLMAPTLPQVTVHHQAGQQSIGIDPLVRVDQPVSDHDPVIAQFSI